MKKRVCLFGDWGESSLEMGLRIKRAAGWMHSSRHNERDIPECMGIEYVSEDSRYDYAVLFNFPEVEVKCPKENRVGLCLEPPEILDLAYGDWRSREPEVARYWAFSSGTPWEQATGVAFTTVGADDWIEDLEAAGREHKKVCMFVSDKHFTPWHDKRHEIAEALAETDLGVDFYGRGMKPDGGHKKGEVPPYGKGEILRSYEYTIDFENSPHRVVTEKFFDPILSLSTPITNAKVLREVLPRGGYHLVDFDDPTEKIVQDIRRMLEDGPEGWSASYHAITNGMFSLGRWISDRMAECES